MFSRASLAFSSPRTRFLASDLQFNFRIPTTNSRQANLEGRIPTAVLEPWSNHWPQEVFLGLYGNPPEDTINVMFRSTSGKSEVG